jgi:hypothetical protein
MVQTGEKEIFYQIFPKKPLQTTRYHSFRKIFYRGVIQGLSILTNKNKKKKKIKPVKATNNKSKLNKSTFKKS